MSEYPIQVEKVHAPPLRDDILSRPRLLDWLDANARGRVTLVIAEAGYGKTTLLADFARRTSLRVLWYRLDRGDRDWVGFIAHLVAAVRVHVPDFGPKTSDLLRATGSSAPQLDTVLNAFISELADLPPDPTLLILDDFHLAQESEAVRTVTEELLSRGPSRLSVVISGRAKARLRIARLRSQGQVSELLRDELRFDSSEVDAVLRLGVPIIEHRLMVELEQKTQGWPASIQLVKAALRGSDRAGARALVRGIGRSHSPVYEYLAEEVTATLSTELQSFLMRTSLLEVVTPVDASAVTGLDPARSADLIDEARELGLLGPISDTSSLREYRAHPLIREFFQNRLASQLSHAELAGLNLALAQSMEPRDWRLAASHYLAAGKASEATRVVREHLHEIIGRGAFFAGADILAKARTPPDSLAGLVIAARVALQRGKVEEALALSNRALELEPTSGEAATTLLSARNFAGDVSGAIEAAQLLETSMGHMGRQLGAAYMLAMRTSVSGRIDTTLEALEALAEDPEHISNARFYGVTLVNQGLMLKASGNATGALEVADRAIEVLSRTSAEVELVSATLVRAWALAHLGDIDAARSDGRHALASAPVGQQLEVSGELAEIEFYYGDFEHSLAALDSADSRFGDGRDQSALVRSQLLAIRPDQVGAAAELNAIEPGRLRTGPAFEVRRQLAAAYLAWAASDPAASAMAEAAARLAREQAATLWERYAGLVAAIWSPSPNPSRIVEATAHIDPAILSMAAEVVAPRLDDLDVAAFDIVAREIGRRRARWLPWLRNEARRGLGKRAIELLSDIGEGSDIELLSELARVTRKSEVGRLAKLLARHHATRVEVWDLGRVRVQVGSRFIDGSTIRRKVLALLCFLVSKPGFSASREDVTEAIWPDLDPEDAINSLNQTAYFLRRLFEPGFREAVSPGYLHQDGEMIWIDDELVSSQGSRCRSMATTLPRHPTVADATHLLDAYPAPFALDFAYEDWAAKFRDPLHATVLRVVEQVIRSSLLVPEIPQAIAVAERALVLEPEAENIQAALIRLYRLVGAHAAAAERYATYADSMRSLGVEVPPIGEVG